MARLTLLVSLLSFVVSHQLVPGVYSTTFTLVNKCDYTVWPGILSNAGEQAFPSTGFALDSGASKSLDAPAAWGGRFWGRTHCSQDSTGKFSCLTGDCGSGKVECSGSGASPPATLAEFKLGDNSRPDFFDVSLVDGFNLPLQVAPQGGSAQNCNTTGCVVDLNAICPSELKVTSGDGSEVVACNGPCAAIQRPVYCCSGAYSSPATCQPSLYAQLFKKECPLAYSYAYDDSTSTFTCAAHADYVITFCPSPDDASKKSSPGNSNSTVVYVGTGETSGALASDAVAGLVSVGVAVWRLWQLS